MEIQELRIGNYVREHYNGEMIVDGMVDHNASGFGYCFLRQPTTVKSFRIFTDQIKPIKLTNEWMKRLNWTETYRPEFLGILENYDIVVGAVHYQKGLEKFAKVIFYVHQYQNLYYELTGKQLKIKEA